MITKEVSGKKSRISTILTGTNPQLGTSLESQLLHIADFGRKFARVFVTGAHQPPPFYGLTWLASSANPPIANMLKTYGERTTEPEAVALVAPNVELANNGDELVGYVNGLRIDLAWAARVFGPKPSEAPVLFVMSSSVLGHVAGAIPPTLTFASNTWAKWLHEWLGRNLLSGRYFDATESGLIAEPAEVLNAYNITPELPEAPKGKRARKQQSTIVVNGGVC